MAPRNPRPLARATSPTTFHAWDRLPEELKLEVLSHNLTLAEEIDNVKHRELLESTLSPLIATRNRHLTNITEEVYYNSNHFIIDINEGLENPKPRTAAMIRHLHVNVAGDFLVSRFGADVMFGVRRWLLKSQEPFGSTQADTEWSEQGDRTKPESRLHWQTTFTGLQTLKLTWYSSHWVDDDLLPSECCCPEPATRWKAINDWLGKTGILLRARKVECEMHAHYQRRDIGWQVCRAHDDVLKHLQDMATKE